ncbi:MAG: GDP-mannose 4,6-dehydratase [Solirubrobacterales bacterium]|nr:GDP-mannose 4,6-dehydratase [Solirubrobacterales bacterium]
MTEKSVLVTGGAGFIGSHLAERCLERGWHVVAIDAFTDYYDQRLKRRNVARALEDPSYDLIEADLLELDLEELVRPVAAVFHLAAQPGVRISWDQFELYARQNVTVTHRLLEAARKVSLERLVIASSSSVYGDAESLPTGEDVVPRPVSPYGVTKVATEQLAHVYWRSFGVPTVCLRYFTVYGPRQRPDMAFNRLIALALRGEPFEVYGDGEQTRDFTFVADAITGTVAASERGKPGAAYNLGGGSRRSMNSVLDTLSDLLGRSVERAYLQPQRGDARDTAADIARAQGDLGYEPAYEFHAGLESQLAWQQALVETAESLS